MHNYHLDMPQWSQRYKTPCRKTNLSYVTAILLPKAASLGHFVTAGGVVLQCEDHCTLVNGCPLLLEKDSLR